MSQVDVQLSPYVASGVIDGAVALLIVETTSTRNAMTISCFSEVAHYPAAIWVSIEKSAYTHDLLSTAKRFSLAVLSRNQRALALKCAYSGRTTDKCAALDLYRSPSGYLFLADAIACTGAEVIGTNDFKTHTLFVANIVEAILDSRSSHLRQLLISDLEST
jgi:flavin reductase (DIM6/NTAB) family NADH-FMN oxidoreductase RutF